MNGFKGPVHYEKRRPGRYTWTAPCGAEVWSKSLAGPSRVANGSGLRKHIDCPECYAACVADQDGGER